MKKNDELELKEKLAAIEHERWSDWQAWVHTLYKTNNEMFDTYIERWEKQIVTPYSELTDKEKAADMEQVDRYWPLITSLIAERERKARIDELKRAHRCGGLNDYDNETDEYIDERLEALTEGNDMVENRWNGFSGSSEPSKPKPDERVS